MTVPLYPLFGGSVYPYWQELDQIPDFKMTLVRHTPNKHLITSMQVPRYVGMLHEAQTAHIKYLYVMTRLPTVHVPAFPHYNWPESLG